MLLFIVEKNNVTFPEKRDGTRTVHISTQVQT